MIAGGGRPLVPRMGNRALPKKREGTSSGCLLPRHLGRPLGKSWPRFRILALGIPWRLLQPLSAGQLLSSWEQPGCFHLEVAAWLSWMKVAEFTPW